VGAANIPDQFKSLLNAWSRERATNADYTGEQFLSDLAAAGAAKYCLGKDYMESVFSILASHTLLRQARDQRLGVDRADRRLDRERNG
jgi:hypothetical protein